jgi:hypothetical protein
MHETKHVEKLIVDMFNGDEEALEQLFNTIMEARSFEDAYLLTRDRGVVLDFMGGHQIQMTIVKSR